VSAQFAEFVLTGMDNRLFVSKCRSKKKCKNSILPLIISKRKDVPMTKNLKMTLKIFTEEYTQILQNYSTDDLKGVLINMANEVTPDKRGEFIRKISLQQPGHALITESSETLLIEIESLIEDIRAQCEEEPD
jgi:hypothetical protein